MILKNIIKKILLQKGKIVSNIYFDKMKFEILFKKIHPIHGGYSLIRIGSNSDGGYLIPNDLSGIKYCFSPGVSDNSSFEESLFFNNSIQSYLCDNSIDSPNSKCEGIHFIKKHLGLKNNNELITFQEWINENPNDNEMILQMDIEGDEYDIILNTTNEILEKFRIIVIEFHAVEQIFTYGGFKLFDNTIQKILTNHTIVHIHPNNVIEPFKYLGYEIPTGIEVTFLRNDRIKNITGRKDFPHKLDFPTNIGNKDFKLPKCFYERVN